MRPEDAHIAWTTNPTSGPEDPRVWREAFDPSGRRGRRGRGPGRGRGRGRGGYGPGGGRAGRGDVRAAILALLADEPMHGYQIIGEIEDRTRGAWKPSPGSVYPTLQMLEDEGLVRAESEGGRNVFHLTDTGRAAAESADRTPWDAVTGDAGYIAVREAAAALMAAFKMLAQTGTPDQVDRGRAVLNDARKKLYGILAEDPDES